jgi:3-hydroxy-9,10-secoandrosta-1,3,5(10)-triene-9,17-dione monooxygenase
MASQYSLGSPRAQQLLASAEALQPALRERAAKATELRRIPDETIQDFQDAGFFKILQPEQWGGYAMDPQVFYAVQLKIAEACMSSGWVLGVVAVHNWQLALFDNQAAVDVWSDDATTLISSSYAPVGKVEKVEGGFKLSGQWGFSSGSQHCDWVFLGAVVPEEGAPFDMKNYRTFLVPRSDYEIIDTWHVVGLQGTGSQDIKVVDAFVPEHRTHKLADGFSCQNPGNAVNDAPLFHLPFGQVFVRSVCTGSLGALEGCLQAFIEMAKKRVIGPNKMIDDPFARRLVAEVRCAIEEMKVVMYNNFDAMMALAGEGKAIPLDDRARYRYDSAAVAERCAALSARMLQAIGSKGIFLGNQVLPRHLDIMASLAHVANNTNIYSNNLGGMQFGADNVDLNM